MKQRAPVEPLRPGNLYDPCIKCTICVTACPVAKVSDAFPGPKQAGPDAERFRGRGEPAEGAWINLCNGCYRCQVACPANIPIAEINAFAKQRYAAARGRDVATHLLTHAALFMPLGVRFAALANPLLGQAWSRWLAEKLFGIDRRAPLPPFARRRFSAEVKGRQPRSQPGRRKVAYFYGCYTDSNAPEIGHAVLRVLAAAGVEAQVPPQTCCGAALLGAGNFDAAQRPARRNLDHLRGALHDGCEAIVVGSPSCALALSHEMSAALGLDCGDVAEKVVDVLTYLDGLLEAGDWRPRLQPLELDAAYHEACHLTALGRGANALRVLQHIPGLRLRALDAGCCGLAGTFGMKKKTAPLARAIGQGLAERLAAWRPQVVLSECEGCRMQITALSGIRTLHPVMLLAESLDLPANRQ